MKTTITILLLSTAIAAVMAYTAPQAEITEISVLGDITDSMLAQPKAEEILPLFGTSLWNGRIFRYRNISDVDYNRARQISLESEQMWFSNSLMREKKVENFRKEAETILAGAKDSSGRSHTSAYIPIAMELNLLAKSKAQKRILLVFSDLMENGTGISFYGKPEIIKNHADSLMKYFEEVMPLEPLDGIAVYLIYEPQDNQDSERFRAVSEFYRTMLESKGAEVIIGANLVL